MMFATLLETSYASAPTFVMGLGAFLILMTALGWVIGMGSGRPHNK